MSDASSDASPMLQLPHSNDCLVCGRQNPHGLHLDLFINPETGVVKVDFTPTKLHTGFEGVIHGGILATVVDEAMVWAATWAGKRFCLCGELTTRFRSQARVGETLTIEALVDFRRPKLVEPSAKIFDSAHRLIATAAGKYVPVSAEVHQDFLRTLVANESTQKALATLS